MTRAARRAGMAAASALVALFMWAGEATADPVIAAAGDIACDPADPAFDGDDGTRCQQRATSDLLVGARLAAVLPLGDLQYNSTTAANLAASYDPSWGRVKSITRPILGNHDGPGGSYFTYFNGAGEADGPAGPRPLGYYSYDIGSWHLVALNSNCALVPCGAGSAQERWLRADLAAHPAACTLAYWHHPRYSSGHGGSNEMVQPLWQALHDAGVEILLSGSSHDYERFAPRDGNGATSAVGIQQFVVGTGGAYMTGLSPRLPGSQAVQNHTFGVLKLTLHSQSYDWQFVPIAGKAWSDSGSAQCHGPPGSLLVRAQPAPTLDRTPPRITNLRLDPRRFKRRAVFRYTLSERATVRFGLARRRGGARYRRVAKFRQAGVAGANARPLRRIVRGRRLRAGRFRATVVARDAAGNYSRPVKARFRIAH